MAKTWFKLSLILLFLYSFPAVSEDVIIDGRTVVDDVLDERIIISASQIPDYREQLRGFVTALSAYAKEHNPEFILAVKGGRDLFLKTQWEENLADLKIAEANNDRTDEEVFLSRMFNPPPPAIPVGTEMKAYLESVDAWFGANLVCSGASLPPATEELLARYGIPILSIENCDIRQKNARYVSGYMKSRTVTDAPPVNNTPGNIYGLNKAGNLFFIIDNSFYKTKDEMLQAFRNNNYDVLVINPFFRKNLTFNREEIDLMKTKKIGGKRLVIAYFNIAVINDGLYFWKKDWRISNPPWIRLFSPFSQTDYVVEYWHHDWQDIAYEYLRGVMELGFDGILLDGLDYHYMFEKLTPI